MDQRLGAFWEYDLFPHYLFGEILSMTPDGNVVIKGYQGMTFKPVKIMPFDDGENIWRQITRINDEFIAAREQLMDDAMDKIIEVLPL